MDSLHEFQQQFARELLEGDSTQLAIYRNNMFVSLRELLQNAYPTVLALVGEEFFIHMARRYVRQVPLESGSVRYYGDQFAQFLAEQPELAQLPYLPDVARYEWLRYITHDGPLAEQSFPFAKLEQLNESQQAQIRFVLAPSMQQLSSVYPVFTLHQQIQANALSELSIDSAERVYLWRQNDGVHALPCPLDLSLPFGELLAQTPDAMAYIQPAIQQGLIIDFTLPQA